MGDHMRQVDVAMVTFNTRQLTIDAIGHLYEAEPELDLRVLVHDNASSDGSAAAIQAAHPRVEVEAGDRNLGFAAGMNRVLHRSRAPWILLLNSDAWPEPGAISRLLEASEAHPEAGLTVPRIEHPDGALEHSAGPFPSLKVAAMCAVGGYQRWMPHAAERNLLVGAWNHDRARVVDWAVGAVWLLRRAAIDDVGGFDESYFFYTEDLEWCWRARQRGWVTWFEPRSRFHHLGGASSPDTTQGDKAMAYMANTNRFYREAHGRPAAVAYRALNALGSARLWAAARLRGDATAAELWRAHVAANLGRGRPVVPRPPKGEQ